MKCGATIKHIVLSFAAMTLLAMPSFATVGIVNEGVGTTTFQRNAENGTYSVNVRLSVGAAANISALEANVTYNNTIFSDVAITDANAGGSIWETSVVNANYSTNGTTTTVKFMKASTNGDYWSVSAGQTPSIYTLTFRVKNNAAVGTTKIAFDTNYAKVQDAVTGNITGTLTNTTYTIALDQVAPTTSVVNGNVGGYYKAPVTVLLDTSETNDEATINYTTDGSVPNFTSGYYIRSSGNVTIPSGNNTLVITTLNYLSRDWAQDKAANEEATVKTQVYYVDTQLPVISNVSYTAGPLATGYYAYVTFNVADNSNLLNGDPVVSFTGGTATKVSGSGVGQFVYRKQIASGDNDGTNHVDISITATDMAGNQDVNSISDAIALDFGAPSFTVTANPNPAAFLTWVTINVTASETLESPGYPSVVVSPGNPANYYASNGTSSTFRYFVTGNGWTAVVPWLNSGSFGDETAPQVMAIVPTSGATAVSITSDIVLRITDNITVVTGSVRITINNELAVAGGAGLSPTYSAFAMSVNNDGVVAITLNPSVNFVPLSRVTVNVSVLDNAGNNSVYTYVFDTKAAGVHNVSYTPNRHYNEIQSALDDAAVNQIIELDAGTYDQGVTINWPNTTGLTIRGASGTTSANVIISGGKMHRIFDMNYAVSLSMSGLSIMDGFVSGNHGGAFYCTPNMAMTINITNTIISGNIVSGESFSGGAFYASNARVFLLNSFVNNNNAYHGGVASYGMWIAKNNVFSWNTSRGGGVAYYGDWTANNNLFSKNNANNGFGGVAYYGDWTANNNTFSTNSAVFGGVANGGTWTANSNTFSGNSASYGGGVASDGSWSGNNNTFSGNSAEVKGGVAAGTTAVYWSETNSIFWGNKENGVTKNDLVSCAQLTLNYCSMSTADWSSANTIVVTNNLIIGDPKFQSTVSTNAKFLQLAYGSPCIDTGTSNTTVTDDIRGYARPMGYGYDMGAYEYEELFLSEFAPAKTSTRNTVTSPISFRVRDYVHPSASIVLGITVNGTSYTSYTRSTDNSTTSMTDFYATFTPATYASFVTINVTVNAKCASINVQDAYYFRTTDVTPPTVNPVVPAAGATGISITSNVSFKIVDDYGTVPTATLQVTINGQTAVVNGLGISTYNAITFGAISGGYSVTIDPNINFVPLSTVTVDVTIADDEGNPVSLTYIFNTKAAGVHNVSYAPNRHYNEIQSALDDAIAGQIIELDAGTYDQGVTINWPNTTGLTIRGASGTNSSNVIISGGKTHRIFDVNHAVNINVSGLSMMHGYVNDTAAGIGGGAWYITSNVVLNLDMIVASGNTTTGNNTDGGFLYAKDDSALVNVLQGTFINNRASRTGGVSYRGSWSVSASIFNDNGDNGRGVMSGGVAVYGTWTVNDSTFSRNYAGQFGGVMASMTSFSVTRCSFIENHALGNGGVIHNSPGSIADSRFIGNYVSNISSGGVFSNANEYIYINNSLFFKNYAHYGSVANGGSFGIMHSTFYENRSTQNAVFYSNSYLTVVNSIFRKNYSQGLDRLEFSYPAQFILTNCLVATTNYVEHPLYSTINGLLMGDPKFASEVSTDAKFLQLAYESPCFDSGTSNVSLTTDIFGRPRPMGNGYDRGAYEYAGLMFTDYTPVRSTTGNSKTADIVFRVRDYLNPKTTLTGAGVTVNGTRYTGYTTVSDNSTADTTDLYMVFDVADLPDYATINIEVSGSSVSYNISDAYWFRTGDFLFPFITPFAPTHDGTGVMPWVTVVFDVTDNSFIVTSSLMVTFDRQAGVQKALSNGAAQPSYSVAIGAIPNGYRVSIDHDVRFLIAELVTVNVLIKDIDSNTTTLSYVFQIITDATGPSPAYSLRAVASPNVHVALSWQHATPGDVYAFRVYRVQATAPAGEGVLLTTMNSSVTTYIDATVATPNSYYYYVKAEDIYWNIGEKSNYAGAPYIKVTSRNYTVQAPSGYSGAGADLVPGAKVSFVSMMRNIGYSPANNVEFKDAVPAHTHFVTGSALCSDAVTLNYQHEQGGIFDEAEDENILQLRWQLQNMIEPFEERTVSFSVTVD